MITFVVVGLLGIIAILVGALVILHDAGRALEFEPEDRDWAALRRQVGRARRQKTDVAPRP